MQPVLSIIAVAYGLKKKKKLLKTEMFPIQLILCFSSTPIFKLPEV